MLAQKLVPLAHANAEDVIRGRTTAHAYEMHDHAGRPTTDHERAARVFALDSQGQTLAIFATGRIPPSSFAAVGKVTSFKQGANLQKETIRQQCCFAFPTGNQLQLF